MRVIALLVGLMLLLVAAPAQAGTRKVVCRLADDRIDESSALVADGDTLITTNDSGDAARVFLVDKQTCATTGVTTYAGGVTDVEALAAGLGDTLWVGDIGDNNGVRSHITLYRMPMPGPGDRTVSATAYDLVYPDGAHDAETLLIEPTNGRVYVVTKGLLAGTVYVAPKRLRSDRTNVLRAVASAPSVTTDGAFFPDGKHVLLRDYWSATVLRVPGFTILDSFRLPHQAQGEGIALDGSTMLLSSEGVHAPVLSVPIPAKVLAELVPEPTGTPTSARSPEPASTVASTTSGSWGGPSVPIALGAAWVVVLGGAVTWWLRRRSRNAEEP
ncbi:MAG: hypothetical protein QM655_05760 [Nocardioidaceae bacterium]